MEKIKWKHRIFIVIQTILLYGIVLILLEWLLWGKDFEVLNFRSIIIQSILFGVIFPLGFLYLLEKMAPRMIQNVKTPTLEEDEDIQVEGGANLFRNKWIAVGGKLFLTNKRIIFNTHKYNFQRGETSVLLSDIRNLINRKTNGLVDNGLRIETAEEKYDFVVSEREKWIEEILKHAKEAKLKE